jgi:serine/threonine-protein kinase ATR
MFVHGRVHNGDLQDFLLGFCLGILSRTQNFVQDHGSRSLVHDKLQSIRGLDAAFKLFGHGLSNFSPQVLGLLQTIIEIDDLYETSLDLWKTFVKNISKFSLRELFVQVCMNLIPNRPLTPKQNAKLLSIFTFMCIENKGLLSSLFVDVYDILPKTDDWKPINEQIKEYHPEKKLLVERLGDIQELLLHENATVIFQTLDNLTKLLELKSLEIQKLLLEIKIDNRIKKLVKSLFLINRKYCNTNTEISVLALESLGIIGAVDPSRMDIHLERDKLFNGGLDLSSIHTIITFACVLLEFHFTPTFKATQDQNLQNVLAFTIQEVLKFCGFNRDHVDYANLKKPKIEQPKSGSSKIIEIWRSFPKSILTTIEPLVDSRYNFNEVVFEEVEYPIYPTQQSYNHWLRAWSLNMIPKIAVLNVFNLFKKLENIINTVELNFTQLLLPHLLFNVLANCDAITKESISKEFLFVLGLNNEHHQAIQTIFMLCDHLQKCVQTCNTEIQKQKNNPVQQTLEKEVENISSFLDLIPEDYLAKAAMECNSYPRALKHYENYCKDNVNSESLDTLMKIYAELEDCDSIEGISKLLVNPNLEQQIILNKVGGKWPAAQSCYEVLLQQKPDEMEYQLGLLQCLQNMGHYESMITFSKGMPDKVEKLSFVSSACWRLGDWDQLEKIEPQKDFESMLGKLLVCLKMGKEKEYKALSEEMKISLVKTVSAASMESYSQSYEGLHQLTILEVIEQYRKLLGSDNPEKDLKVLVEVWDKKFDLMKPSFKQRESVLNLQRVLLQKTEKLNGLLIDEEMTKLWIKSSKEARKSGYYQTAYSAILQASNLDLVFSRIEHSKWLWAQGLDYEALTMLKSITNRDLKFEKIKNTKNLCLESGSTIEAKANLLLATWMEVTNGLHSTNIISAYVQINREKPQYHNTNIDGRRAISSLADTTIDCWKPRN